MIRQVLAMQKVHTAELLRWQDGVMLQKGGALVVKSGQADFCEWDVELVELLFLFLRHRP